VGLIEALVTRIFSARSHAPLVRANATSFESLCTFVLSAPFSHGARVKCHIRCKAGGILAWGERWRAVPTYILVHCDLQHARPNAVSCPLKHKILVSSEYAYNDPHHALTQAHTRQQHDHAEACVKAFDVRDCAVCTRRIPEYTGDHRVQRVCSPHYPLFLTQTPPSGA
jgi:hypothetical protein